MKTNDLYVVRVKLQGKYEIKSSMDRHPVIHLVGISIYRKIDWKILRVVNVKEKNIREKENWLEVHTGDRIESYMRKRLLGDKNIMNGKDESACNRHERSSFGLSMHEHRK